MPRTFLMTWVPEQKRWIKKHHGKMFSVSCRQLDCEPTQDASWQLANRWWTNLLATTPKPVKPVLDGLSGAMQKVMQQTSETELRQLIRAGEAAQKVLAALEQSSAVPLPPDWVPGKSMPMPSAQRAVDDLRAGRSLPTAVLERVFDLADLEAADKVMVINYETESIKPTRQAIDLDRTMDAQVKSWVEFLRGKQRAKQLSPGRVGAYQRNIQVFANWFGVQADIGSISGKKLEQFYSYLCGKVGSRVYKPSYCQSIFMSTKQFVTRLADLELIPLPSNIRRRYAFGALSEKIVSFTVDEVKRILRHCPIERTRLFFLLMLNCGMLQNDIAELRDDEVDWGLGTIERVRSKTRRRGGRKVKYQLWTETFHLLKKFRSEQELVLLTEEGNKLVEYDGVRYDIVGAACKRVLARLGIKKPLKSLRKTGPNIWEDHKTYCRFESFFLAHSPKGVTERHYVEPSQVQFFKALRWLAEQIGQ